MQLTNRAADALKPYAKPYEVRDDTLMAFLLRVQSSGVKSYYFAYRNNEGKKQRYRIGLHGTLSAMQVRGGGKG